MKQRIDIPVLNTLRFIFMMVIFFHHMNHATMFPHGGYIAVSFFFVLSGFVMTIGYRDRILQADFSFKTYIFRRLTKFYPLHWLVLILFLVSTCNTVVVHSKLYWGEFIANYFLLQSFVPLKDFYFSFNSPSWYLCNTLFYCILFPFILKIICKSGRVIKIAIPILAITAYILLVIFIPKEWQHAILYINPFVRLLDFLLGVYTGLFFLNRFECQSKVNNDNTWLTVIALFCITFLGLIAFGFFDNSIYYLCKWFYWIIFCPMIFAISMISIKRTHKDYGGGRNVISKLFQQGGRYSFTFYMIHYICINLLFAPICERFGVSLFLTTTISFIGTMILTVFCQKFFVEPVGTLLTKKINKYGNNKN